MRLTISSISGGNPQVLQLEVPSSICIQDLKALISSELPQMPSASQHIYYNGRLLSDATRTLEAYNMKDDDMVVVHTIAPRPQPQARPQQLQQQQQMQMQQSQAQHQQHQEYDPEVIRLQLLANPQLQAQLRESNPELVDTMNDPAAFREAFVGMENDRREKEREKQREIQMLNEDPFNVEAQRRIEELIRQEQVMENLQSALEHNPEAFGRVTMLYIPVEVNGIAVKAFVDSGAQATIMSPDCAQRCGIMRLVDSRFAGIARGVGTARILGRVHSAQIKIGNLYLACSFTVMEGKQVELLLGLDMLKRHLATLDLRHNCLIIQDEKVAFLGESEIPKDSSDDDGEPTVEGPSGSKVGARSGAIVEPPAPVIRDNAPRGRYAEEVVNRLVDLGFTLQEAVSALDATNGDVDMAANLLLFN